MVIKPGQYCDCVQALAHVTVKGASDKVAAAELADKEQTILELRETNEVTHSIKSVMTLQLSGSI